MGDAAVQTVGTGALTNLPNVEDIQNQQGIFIAATGSSGAYAITMIPAISSYVEGQRFVVKANHDCPSSPTLNVNSKGAGVLVNPDGSALAAGAIRTDQMFEVVRRGSVFQVTSSLGALTGDTILFFGTTAPAGWLLLQGGTLGNGASGGSARANADTELLFEFLYANMADAEAPVSSGRGASAQADFDANKTITLPDFRGRSPIGSGTGPSLTARTLGDQGGEEDHVLTEAEMPSHTHTQRATSVGGSGGIANVGSTPPNASVQDTLSKGGDAAHNTMHPFTVTNWKIKL